MVKALSLHSECITNKKNAFRYPSDPKAIFPQRKNPLFLDVRTSALPLSIISNQKGVKAITRKRKELMESIEHELNEKKEVKMEEEMKERENEVIDLNKIANVDNEIENLDFENIDLEGNKRKKKKYAKVDLNIEKNNEFLKKERQKKKAQKKSKSRYIVKF